LLAGAGSGCAGVGLGRTGKLMPVPAVEGVWEGFFQDKIDEGSGAGSNDVRMERQAWRLRQEGESITGFYVVELTMISGDGRPYLCSQEPRFSTLLRFEVRGHAQSDGVELEEVGDVLAKGPCRPVFRSPARFKADIRGDMLTLADGGHRFTLYRRQNKEQQTATKQLLAFERPDSSWRGEPAFPTFPRMGSASEPPAEVDGVWLWEFRGRLPTGDEKQEREEWHLEQQGTRVTGYYDRTVRQVSTDGHPYRCSSTLDFAVTTRYHLSGEIQGSKLVLYERSFEIVEGSPCDSGQRRLDAYQGEAALGEIRLMWGVGAQVLRRARPNLPTQRF